MKSVADIKKEIQSVMDEVRDAELSKYLDDKEKRRVIKRLRGKLPQLRQHLRYLESNPTEVYLQGEQDKLRNRMNEIYKHYKPLPEETSSKTQISAARREFEKTWEIPKLRKQVSAISYILS